MKCINPQCHGDPEPIGEPWPVRNGDKVYRLNKFKCRKCELAFAEIGEEWSITTRREWIAMMYDRFKSWNKTNPNAYTRAIPRT